MIDPMQTLKENILFRAASDEENQKLAARAEVDTFLFEAGERIYTPKRQKKAIGIVRGGHVNVFRRSDETVLLNTLGPGEVFGVAGLFAENDEEGNGAVTEIAAASNTEIWFIDGEQIRKLIRENPDFAENYISYLSGKVRFLNRRIADFTAADAEVKTGRYLEQLCRGEDARGQETIPSYRINMSRLARTLDIGRASLYRALDSLESRGIIRRTEGLVQIVDRDALKRMCK